jgi:uncharacterized protein involved in exopolysaccharide biosynthesis
MTTIETAGSAPMQKDSLSLIEVFDLAFNHLRLLLLGPLLVGLSALAISYTFTPIFTATTKFLPPQQQQQGAAAMMLQSLGALGGLAGASSGLKNPADQYVAFLKSRSLQDALIDRFNLKERYDEKFRQDTRKTLDANSAITSGKDGLITVEVDDPDPQVAANIANGYVEELAKLVHRLALTEAQHRRIFFEAQLTETKDKLANAEQALRVSGVNSSVVKATGMAVARIAQLQAQVAAQELKLASMRGYLNESAGDFKQAQTELAAMRSQLASADKDEPVAIRGGEYLARFRDVRYFETLFELFAKQFELAKIDEAREGAVIQVLDTALPPERKSKPKRLMVALISALAAGLLLLIFVYARDTHEFAAQSSHAGTKLKKLATSWRRTFGRF